MVVVQIKHSQGCVGRKGASRNKVIWLEIRYVVCKAVLLEKATAGIAVSWLESRAITRKAVLVEKAQARITAIWLCRNTDFKAVMVCDRCLVSLGPSSFDLG